MYYIEENDKQFKKVKLCGNKLLLSDFNPDLKEKKSIAYAKKTDKILKKTNSNKLVLSKEIQKNEVYKNLLYTYGYKIVDGKWLFEGLEAKILDYIITKKEFKKEECQLSILVNDLKEYTFQNIKNFAKEYKSLNIVTNHLEKFKRIEDQILEEDGLIITVTNNKKKSLAKSEIILNIDFSKELLNKYNIYENAIIVNICGSIKIDKKRFNGLSINDYEISVNDEIINNAVGTNSQKYFVKQLYEAEFYKNMPFMEFSKKIKNDSCEIVKLFSINGSL